MLYLLLPPDHILCRPQQHVQSFHKSGWVHSLQCSDTMQTTQPDAQKGIEACTNKVQGVAEKFLIICRLCKPFILHVDLANITSASSDMIGL
jgi:hypothetical protein